jgi:hypothetical protein
MPWIPFKDDGTPIAIEQRRLFLEMEPNYERNASPSSRRGYNKFRDAWNAETGRRYAAKMRGERDIVEIFAKSTKQLQTYYDHIKQQELMAMQENPAGVQRRLNLNQVLRQTRASIDPPVQATVGPQAFPNNPTSIMPMGAPMTLNSEVSLAGVRARPSMAGCAPYAVPPPKRMRQDANALPAPLDFRHVCKKCGRIKGEHGVFTFGHQCAWISCGRCGLAESRHDGKKMGVHCRVESFLSQVWERKIQELAKSKKSSM